MDYHIKSKDPRLSFFCGDYDALIHTRKPKGIDDKSAYPYRKEHRSHLPAGKALQQVLQHQGRGSGASMDLKPGTDGWLPPGRLEADCRGRRNAPGPISAGLDAPVASRIAALRSEFQPTVCRKQALVSSKASSF
jgi:hypothetical protein